MVLRNLKDNAAALAPLADKDIQERIIQALAAKEPEKSAIPKRKGKIAGDAKGKGKNAATQEQGPSQAADRQPSPTRREHQSRGSSLSRRESIHPGFWANSTVRW